MSGSAGGGDTTGRVSSALLLAAGRGSRFSPVGEPGPKCLAEVDGRPILLHLLGHLRASGFQRLVIVTGYMANRIRDYALANAGGLDLVFIDNPDYATTNNIYSLWLARDHVTGPLLLVESDLLFDRELLIPLLAPDRMAVSEILPWMSGTTVDLDECKRVESFSLPGQGCRPGRYKTVNLYSLSSASWRRVLARLDEHVGAGRTGSYYELVFSELVAEGVLELEAVPFPSERWYEVDTVEDQREASRLFASLRRGAL